MIQTLFLVAIFVTAVFLIVLVLIQRGKGGGLAGALGGMGGQSAFGTKAGDLFTRITMVVAAFWIILCLGAVKYFGSGSGLIDVKAGPEPPPVSAPAAGGAKSLPPAGGGQERPAAPTAPAHK